MILNKCLLISKLHVSNLKDKYEYQKSKEIEFEELDRRGSVLKM